MQSPPDTAMLAAETIGLDELAPLLGRTPDWLKANWRRLHRKKDFPRQLPGSDGRWSRVAVIGWIRANGELPPEQEPDGFIGRERAALHAQLGVGQ